MSLIDWKNHFDDCAPSVPVHAPSARHCFERVALDAPNAPKGMDICNLYGCERFEERAAIIEFEAGMSRQEAEFFAMKDCCSRLEECLNFTTR